MSVYIVCDLWLHQVCGEIKAFWQEIKDLCMLDLIEGVGLLIYLI